MDRQIAILDLIAGNLLNARTNPKQEVRARFRVDEESVDTLFEIKEESSWTSKPLPIDVDFEHLDLVLELRKEMKSHSGGDWSEFTVHLDETSQANAKFKYPETS